MEKEYENVTSQELYIFSKKIKKLIGKNQLERSRQLIIDKMIKYPDCAEPHNLLGIIEEINNNHVLAMKHFRAAWALDPTYEPARRNMEVFGEFTSELRNAVYTVDDMKEKETHSVVYKIIHHSSNKSTMKKISMF